MRSNRGKRRDDAGPASPRRHRLVKLLALLAALMFLAAACGGNDSDDDSAGEDTSSDATDDFAVSAAEDTEEGFDGATATTFAPDVGDRTETEDLADSDVDGDAATDEEGDGGDRLGAGGATVTPTAADIGRKLTFIAHVHVEVDDVAAASAEATSIVQGMGGFVFGQNTSGGSEPSSELVFKILPEDFNRALEALGNVGELRNQSVTTDDVTERIVDLESRIQVSQLGVERLRAALEGAATLEDYAEIERLLLDRESNLEVMRGQLRTLEDRVDLATITLLLTQDRVENFIDLTISAYEAHDNGESCPGQGGYS
ncbi:MAG: DUF4349 domain-containing protein, partial [Actinomycetia bacterium]|nr:DUF4349 domain-containing protein [Actinomycetes bacterium]